MKKLFLLLMILALTTCTIQARENSLLKGKKAIQFGITDNFTLSSYQGSVISIKKHSSDGSAWRLGLSLNFDINEDEDLRRQNDTLLNEYSTDYSRHAIGLSLQKLFYPNPKGDVIMFYGLGPTFDYDHYKRTRNMSRFNPDRSSTDITTQNSWSVGGRVLLGLEWFATKNISLMAEYGVGVKYRYRKIEDKDTASSSPERIQERTTKAIQFAPSSVRLGLSAYF